MGYYNDSDSEDYVDLSCSAVALSPEEEAAIRATVDTEAAELRAELDNSIAKSAAAAAKFRNDYESKLYKEVAFAAFNRDDAWRALAEQGYIDREYSSIWLGYWAELRTADDAKRALRVGGDLVKAWLNGLVEKIGATPTFSKERASVEKIEALLTEDRDYNEKRVAQYRESRLSFHGLR